MENETMEMINEEIVEDAEVTDIVPVYDYESEYDDYEETCEEDGNPIVGALAIAGGVALIGGAIYGVRKLVGKIKNRKKRCETDVEDCDCEIIDIEDDDNNEEE